MPTGTDLLTPFLRRDMLDHVMFGWVRSITTAMPGVSVESALKGFQQEHNLPTDAFNVKSQKARYQRMLADYFNDQKTDHAKG